MANPLLYEIEPHQVTLVDQCEMSFDGFKQETNNPIQIETIHERKKLNKISCEFCSATFKFECLLKRHVAEVHEGKKPYKCEICSFSSARNYDLIKHIKNVHEGERPFTCETCDKSFKKKGDLNVHVAHVHERKKSFNCNICNLSFSTNRNMNSHIENIHGEGRKSFKCETCNKTFQHKGNLRVHIEAVHERKKPFECDICNLSFSSKNTKILHTKRIHNETPSGFEEKTQFKSNISNRKFLQKSHNEKASYECHECDSRYQSKKDLIDHVMKIHVGESPEKEEPEK